MGVSGRPFLSCPEEERRNRLRILELHGKIEFRPDWGYKKMRGKP